MHYHNVATSHGLKYNKAFPLGQDNHHITLRVENNQSRRRPTSWSLSKLHDSGLYLQLLSQGRTFPLTSPETDGPIVGNSREKVKPLSLTLPLKNGLPYSLSSFSLFLWITLNRTLKRMKLPPSFLHATCPFLDFFSSFSLFLFIFGSLHFSIIPHLSLLLFFFS